MFEAQYLGTDISTGEVFYSPWFPRGGDNIDWRLDLLQAIGAKINVQLLEKNAEDTGNGTAVGSATGDKSTAAVTRVAVAGVKELVRYQFTVKANTNETYGRVLFRMLPPVWFDSGE